MPQRPRQTDEDKVASTDMKFLLRRGELDTCDSFYFGYNEEKETNATKKERQKQKLEHRKEGEVIRSYEIFPVVGSKDFPLSNKCCFLYIHTT